MLVMVGKCYQGLGIELAKERLGGQARHVSGKGYGEFTDDFYMPCVKYASKSGLLRAPKAAF